MTATEALKRFFGFESFRDGQEEIVEAILDGRDVLAVMPTGSGKSVCYQLPAMLLEGITIVISPLISLMQDQVKALNSIGIRAAFINSSLSESQIEKALYNASKGIYKIIYVAPERLTTEGFKSFAASVDISMITVDEAHCISQWGQDFRPSYKQILDFIRTLPYRPVVSAFTATATEDVKNDIVCVLSLDDPLLVTTGFDRPNLYFNVEHEKDKDDYVLRYVGERKEDSGIIYCATRKAVDEVCAMLNANRISALAYHAGMNTDDRKRNQDDFIYERVNVIVATNAFGMGIDKSNVRYVLHYNMPQSMENYYQEAGRAGRDGQPSECILLFSPRDVMIDKYLLEKKDFSEIDPEYIEPIRQRDISRLNSMENYCRSDECLRKLILRYFGETGVSQCGNCANCCSSAEEIDMTEEAKSVINCLYELKRGYGVGVLMAVLCGSRRERMNELGAKEFKSYGKLKGADKQQLRLLIDKMVTTGLIIRTDDEYSVLKIGDYSALKSGEMQVLVRKSSTSESKTKSDRRTVGTLLTKHGYELFAELKSLRLSIARAESIPPYIVFSDRTLTDMCAKNPASVEDMRNVSGIGANKFDRYAQSFFEVIDDYRRKNNSPVLSETVESEEVRKSSGKPKRTGEFSITAEEAAQFTYGELFYGNDIKNELNRICISPYIKRVTVALIQDRLVMLGYLGFEDRGELIRKIPTEKGEELGIISEQRFLQDGREYFVLRYPEKAQRVIVEMFIGR